MQLVVGVALVVGGRVLAARRSYPSASAGRWELPGGKVHTDETPEEAAVREVDEELGCGVAVTGWLEPEIEITDDLVLRIATAALVEREPIPRAGQHDAVRWLAVDQLDEVDWLEADRPFVAEIARSALLRPV